MNKMQKATSMNASNTENETLRSELGTDRLSNLPEVTQLISRQSQGLPILATWFQNEL